MKNTVRQLEKDFDFFFKGYEDISKKTEICKTSILSEELAIKTLNSYSYDFKDMKAIATKVDKTLTALTLLGRKDVVKYKALFDNNIFKLNIYRNNMVKFYETLVKYVELCDWISNNLYISENQLLLVLLGF